jgi:hypothetical protein
VGGARREVGRVFGSGVFRRGIALLIFASGCATTQIAGQNASSVEQATLAVGGQAYRIDACASGGLEQFLGVDLGDEKAGAIARVVIDPIDGPRLKVAVRGIGSVVFSRNQCSQLEADVRPTNWIINNVRAVSGSVNAECRAPSGQTVSLHARFTRCH